MKKGAALLLLVALLLNLCACGAGTSAWQEQYDLGVRYLSDGNYEEAIVAFTAAIEIEPKRAEAYIGAADAYIGMGEYDKACAILEDGLNRTGGDQTIEDKLAEIANHGDDFLIIDYMLKESDALTYMNIPVLFSKNYDALDEVFGLPQYNIREKEETGTTWNVDTGSKDYSYWCNECYYGSDYGSLIKAVSTAPLGSGEIIDASVWGEAGEAMEQTAGWLNICLGDDYATVLQKLHLDAGLLTPYSRIEIDIISDGGASGSAIRESEMLYNGVHTPQIYVLFCNAETGVENRVVFEFIGGDSLTRVSYENQTLFEQLTAE